jgi:hypothetical protein
MIGNPPFSDSLIPSSQKISTVLVCPLIELEIEYYILIDSGRADAHCHDKEYRNALLRPRVVDVFWVTLRGGLGPVLGSLGQRQVCAQEI